MHKFILVRGIDRYIRRWLEDFQNVYLKYKRTDSKGNKSDINASIVVRPIQLYEVIYPEEQEENLSRLLGNSHDIPNFSKTRKWIMRMLGLEMPESKLDITNMTPTIPRPNVSITILGNKKDLRDSNGNEML